jgi:hypothetical protein
VAHAGGVMPTINALTVWCGLICSYYQISQIVRPKQVRVAEIEAKLALLRSAA